MAETARKARLSVPSSSLPWLVDRFPCDRPAPTACDAGDQGARCAIQAGGGKGVPKGAPRGQAVCRLLAASSCPNLRSVMRHPVVSPLILRIEITRLTVGSGKKRPPKAGVNFYASRPWQAARLLISRPPPTSRSFDCHLKNIYA